jgi:hypothetical protein
MTEATASIAELPETTTPAATGAADPPATTTAEPSAKPAGDAAKPAAGQTMAEGAEQTPAQAKAEAKWRDDWREALAAGDDKALARLKRFQSIDNVYKSWSELDRKMASGTLKTAALPENPSEDDIAAYRKAWDVPETAKDYGIEPPQGLTFGDADKQSLDAFLAKAHASNIPKAHVQSMASAFFEQKAIEEQQLYEAAVELTTNHRAEIKAEWGRDYDRNARLGNADMVQVLGEEKAKGLASLTLSNGTKLGDHPDFVRYIVGSAMRSAEEGLLITPDAATGGKSVDDQIKEIQALKFGNDVDRAKFHDPETQKRYEKLYQAKTRSRAA